MSQLTTLGLKGVVDHVAAAAPAWPALGALLISALALRGRRLSEQAIVIIAQAVLWGAFFCVVVGSTLLLLTALAHQSLRARRQQAAADDDAEAH